MLVDTTFGTLGSAAPSPDNVYILKGAIECNDIDKRVVIENGKGYQLKVAAEDAHGNVGPRSEASDIVWYQLPDSGLPETPVITTACNQFKVSWESSAESGIVEYQYAIGTTPGGIDSVKWTSTGTGTKLNLTGLGLTPGEIYYVTVRARDEAGVWSSAGISLPITYPGIPGDIDGDCSISRGDARLALEFAVGSKMPTDHEKWSADMNADGKIGSDDALLILRKANDSLAAPNEYIIVTSPGNHVNVLLPQIHGIAGENIRAPITIRETDAVRSGDIGITYDSSVLRPLNVSSAPDVLMAINTTEPGLLRIAFVHIGRHSGSTMFEMQFAVLSDDVSSLEFESIELYGDDGRPLRSSGVNGKFNSWAIPAEHSALLQNFPNPFNPETWIPYQLREDSEVTFRIYNSSGKLVRRLPLGHRSAGHYVSQDRAIHWDGRNEAGEIVASGLYFVVLKAGDYQRIRRMSLIR